MEISRGERGHKHHVAFRNSIVVSFCLIHRLLFSSAELYTCYTFEIAQDLTDTGFTYPFITFHFSSEIPANHCPPFGTFFIDQIPFE